MTSPTDPTAAPEPSAVNVRETAGRARRELTVVASVAVVGAVLAVYASGRTWATAGSDVVGTVARGVKGSELTAGAALGWAGLAAVFAVFATRGRGRVAVGALMTLLGVAIAVPAMSATARSDVVAAVRESSAVLAAQTDLRVASNAWWMVAVVGGLLLASAGVVTALGGSRWPGMSARYDRKAAPSKAMAAADPSSLWKSLDRGEDPTAADGEGSRGADPAADDGDNSRGAGTLPDGPHPRATSEREL